MQACGGNMTSNAGAVSAQECYCTVGFYYDGGACLECEQGNYCCFCTV